jgi:hypothetical protein
MLSYNYSKTNNKRQLQTGGIIDENHTAALFSDERNLHFGQDSIVYHLYQEKAS